MSSLESQLLEASLGIVRGHVPDASEAEARVLLAEALLHVVDEVRNTPRLTPFEVDLYRVPGNGLAEMLKSLGADEDTLRLFHSARTHWDRVRVVSRRCGPDGSEAPPAVLDRLYAARSTVQPYRLDGGDSPESILAALAAVAVPGAEMTPLDEVPRPTHSLGMPDGRLAVIYGWKVQSGKGVIDPEGRLVEPAAQKSMAVLLDVAAGTVETRGTGTDAARVVKQFTHDLERGGLTLQINKLQLSGVEFDALKEELRGTLVRETYTGADEAHTGIGTQSANLSTKYRGTPDLTATPGYADLPEDRNLHHWFIRFIVDGSPYSVRINFRDGRLVFQEGKVSDQVIRFVLDAIARVRAGR